MANKRIEANSIAIKDPNGKTVIFMGVEKMGDELCPVIRLVDGNTQGTRIELVARSRESHVAIYDEQSDVMRANLRVMDDGRSVCGAYGSDGSSYAVTLIDWNGDPMVEVKDAKGEIVFKAPGEQHSGGKES